MKWRHQETGKPELAHAVRLVDLDGLHAQVERRRGFLVAVPDILMRSGPLRAVSPIGTGRLQPGHIHVAAPDYHLLIEPNRLRIAKGPRENRFRPAIDPLFRSAAQVYGPNAVGVILTGSLDDGAAGLWAVKQMGGTTIVQDPYDAMFPGMPQSALQLRGRRPRRPLV